MLLGLWKGRLTLLHLRSIVAILVALSLSLAPISSAWAAKQMLASMDLMKSAGTVVADDSMSDCMKAMQARKPDNAQHCPCCDTASKTSCPDDGACLAKCSVHVIAVLTPAVAGPWATGGHDSPAVPQKPPDWLSSPPAPPPRT
jgi:hypothetical protein